jgi:hypothetical protein
MFVGLKLHEWTRLNIGSGNRHQIDTRSPLVVIDGNAENATLIPTGEILNKRGRQTVIWDGRDDAGNPVGEGLFICRICIDGEVGDSQTIWLLAST